MERFDLISREKKRNDLYTVFADNLVGLGFLQSVSYIKPILSHEKSFAVGKSGRNATFNPFFLGLGWPWVGEFVGFIVIFKYFPTQQNLVNRKHPLFFFLLQEHKPRKATRIERNLV